jgi:hypothetical protein
MMTSNINEPPDLRTKMASSSSITQILKIAQFAYNITQFLAEKELQNADFAHLKEPLSRNHLEQRRILCDISNDYTVNGKPNHNMSFLNETRARGMGLPPVLKSLR